MERITKEYLEKMVDSLNEMPSASLSFEISWAYGNPVLYSEDFHGKISVISPILPKRVFAGWISAFTAGFGMGYSDAKHVYSRE